MLRLLRLLPASILICAATHAQGGESVGPASAGAHRPATADSPSQGSGGGDAGLLDLGYPQGNGRWGLTGWFGGSGSEFLGVNRDVPLREGLYGFAYPSPYGGIERFLVGVPKNPTGEERPVLVGFHGFSISELDVLTFTSFPAEAYKRGWYFLLPLGRHDAINFEGTYSSPNSQAMVAQDLDLTCQIFPIDVERIYGVGFSMGGGSVTNFAARYQAYDRPTFAALANHTGSTSIAHVYDEAPPPISGFPVQDYLDYTYGGPPATNPFGYSQASTIDFDGTSVDPTTDLARNLTHVPVQVWSNLNESNVTDYLRQETLAFADHLFTTLGGTGELIEVDGPSSPPLATHSWDILEEKQVCDFFAGRTRLRPMSGSSLADRDGTFFWFDVTQTSSGAFSPFSWQVSFGARRVELGGLQNISRIQFASDDLGFPTGADFSIELQVDDAQLPGFAPTEVVFDGVDSEPWRVLLDGQPYPRETTCSVPGSWCHDAAAGELSVTMPVGFDDQLHLIEVDVLAPPVDQGLSTLQSDVTGDLLADGSTTATFTASVVQPDGYPLSGAVVSLAGDLGASVSPASMATDALGQAVFTATSLVAGSELFTASVEGVDLLDTEGVVWIGNPGDLSAGDSSAALGSSTFVAGGSTTLTVTVRDSNANPVGGVEVLVSAPAGLTVDPASLVSGADGSAAATLDSTVSGTYALALTMDPAGAAIDLPVDPVEVLPAAPDPALSSLTVATPGGAGQVLADGIEVATLSVLLVDAFGNAVPSQQLLLEATGSGNSGLESPVTTDAMGSASATLASTTAETKLLSATVDPGGLDLTLDDAPTVEFVGDPGAIDSSQSTLSVGPVAGIAADGLDTALIEVVVRDVNGNPVEGQAVVVEVDGVGNTITQPGSSSASGQASGNLASTAAETKVVRARVNPGTATEVLLDDAPAVTFVWDDASTYYVRTTGSDTSDGSSPARAWATLSHAAAQVGPGDTVLIGAGTYAESPVLFTSGSSEQPIRWLADRSGEVTGDAGEVLVDGGGASSTLTIDGASFQVVEGLTLVGASPGASTGAGLLVTGAASELALRDLVVYGSDRGIQLVGATAVELLRLQLSGLGGVGQGLLVDGGGAISLVGSRIYGNAGDGIQVSGGATAVSIRSTTVYLNGGDGLHASGAGTQVSVSDCIFSDGLADGVEAAAGASLLTQHCLVFGHGGSDYAGVTADASDLSTDPLLVDPDGADDLLGGAEGADDDLRLQLSSPALDAGSTDAADSGYGDGTVLADATARSDDVLDGSAPDGPELDLGFHAPAPVDGLSPLLEGEVRLVYAIEDDRRPRAIRRTLGGTYEPDERALPVGAELARVLARASRLESDEEFVAVLVEEGTGAKLVVLEWGGAEWCRALGIDLPGDGSQQRFDMCITPSGRVLLVHGDGSARPVLHERVAGRWQAAESLPLNDGAEPGPDLSSGGVEWVRLSCRPDSEEVALVFSDSTGALVGLPHDGSQWDTSRALLLESGISGEPVSGAVDTRSFDLAHEGSGDLLVAWGRQGSTGVFHAELSAGGSWSAVQQAASPGSLAAPRFLALAGQEGGDSIALACLNLEGVEGVGVATWDGAALVDAAELDSQVRDWNGSVTGHLPLALAWTSGGAALCTWSEELAGELGWSVWESGTGWTTPAVLVLPGADLLRNLRLAPSTDGVLGIFQDEALDLRAALFAGSNWGLEAGGAALDSARGGPGTAFDLASR